MGLLSELTHSDGEGVLDKYIYTYGHVFLRKSQNPMNHIGMAIGE